MRRPHIIGKVFDSLAEPLTIRQSAQKAGVTVNQCRSSMNHLLKAGLVAIAGRVSDGISYRPVMQYQVTPGAAARMALRITDGERHMVPAPRNDLHGQPKRVLTAGSGQIAGPCMSRQFVWRTGFRRPV